MVFQHAAGALCPAYREAGNGNARPAAFIGRDCATAEIIRKLGTVGRKIGGAFKGFRILGKSESMGRFKATFFADAQMKPRAQSAQAVRVYSVGERINIISERNKRAGGNGRVHKFIKKFVYECRLFLGSIAFLKLFFRRFRRSGAF